MGMVIRPLGRDGGPARLAAHSFGCAPSGRADAIIPMRPMPGRGRMPG